MRETVATDTPVSRATVASETPSFGGLAAFAVMALPRVPRQSGESEAGSKDYGAAMPVRLPVDK